MNLKRTANINGAYRVAVGLAVAAARLILWMQPWRPRTTRPALCFWGRSAPYILHANAF